MCQRERERECVCACMTNNPCTDLKSILKTYLCLLILNKTQKNLYVKNEYLARVLRRVLV